MSAQDQLTTEQSGSGPAEQAGTSEAASRGARIPALDGIRGLAILAVMLYHFSLAGAQAVQADPTWLDDVARVIFGSGWAGVDLFFVLSGFLITGILLDAKGSVNFFRHFYIRRALRTWPVYGATIFLLIVAVPLFGSTVAESARAIGERTLWYGTFTINILVPFDSAWNPDITIGGHLWSIAVEWQFYLLWPAVVLLFSRRALLVACCCAIVGAFAIRVGFELSGAGFTASYQSMPARMDAFAVGALVAVATRNPVNLLALRTWVPWFAGGALVVLGVLFITLGELVPTDRMTLIVGFSALAVLFGSLLVYGISAKPGDPAYGALISSPLRSLGKYSYALYLFHLPLSAIFFLEFSDTVADVSIYGSFLFGQILIIAVAGAASYLVAWLSWQLLEEPFLRLKGRFPHGGTTSALPWPRASWAIVPVTLAALGLMVFLIVRGGWIQDPPPNDAALAITPSMFREDETGEAIQIMLVGDSIARSLAVGLYGQQDDGGFVLRDISVDSCGVMPGAVGQGETDLYRSRCDAFRDRWQPYINLLDPDVVVLQVSHWDGVDRTIGEREVEAGSPDWETSFRVALQDAVAVFSSRGANVVLLTTPYIGTSSVEPAIIDQLNDGARFVADPNGSGVSLVDLDRLLDQGGAYRKDLKGVTVRSNGDVGFTLDGSELVGDWLAPQLIEVAAESATNDGEGPTDSHGPSRLLNTNTSEDGDWQTWQSALSPVDGGLLVSSTDAAYSASVFTNDSDLPLVQGETYVAIAWVRSNTEAADGEIEIALREESSRTDLSQQFYPMTNYWQPILVEHTIAQADLQSLELLILRLGTDAKPDAFILRNAELRFTSD